MHLLRTRRAAVIGGLLVALASLGFWAHRESSAVAAGGRVANSAVSSYWPPALGLVGVAIAIRGAVAGRKSVRKRPSLKRQRIAARLVRASHGTIREESKKRDWVQWATVATAVIAAVGALIYNGRALDYNGRSLDITSQQIKLAEQGQITERFSKAVDQLGSAGPDRLGVRIGGIYALERIMHDSSPDQPTIIEVLTSFARSSAATAPQSGTKVLPARSSSGDVEAALIVLGRRNVDNDGPAEINIHGTMMRDAIIRPIKSCTWSLGRAKCSEAPSTNLDHVDLSGADVSGSELTGLSLWGADLSETNLTATDLSDVNIVRGILPRAQLVKARLVSTTLIDADLSGADLSGADLTSAVLSGASLHGANLSGAQMGKARLGYIDAHGAPDVLGADMRGANLRRAHLIGADLLRANFQAADMRDADLRQAKFLGSTMRKADLRGADLRGADLREADLQGADLRGADLRGVDLHRTDLGGARLEGAPS